MEFKALININIFEETTTILNWQTNVEPYRLLYHNHIVCSASILFQGGTDIAQHCAFTPGGALVASGSAGLTLAFT